MRAHETAIRDAVAEMPAINHHEHARACFSNALWSEFDLARFLAGGYLNCDLAAAGYQLAPDAFNYLDDPKRPDRSEDLWREMRPYLDMVRSTSYFRYLLVALQDLCGISEEDIFSGRWKEASDRLRQYSRDMRGRGNELCKKANITATILDANLNCPNLPDIDPRDHRVLHVFRMDMFIHEDRGLADTLEQHPARDFVEWLDAFDAVFQQGVDAGAAGFKMGLAYNRRIEYGDPPMKRVVHAFEHGILAAPPEEKTAYQDFMVNRLCRLCADTDLPLQIHTGMQAVAGHVEGEGSVLENTKPTLLTGLFRRHPDLRVDLFHGGYPWIVQAGLMAKYFPNVYVNGCWLPQISPSAYRQALTSWIETVPANKIFAWGGDHQFLEHTYASLMLAKDIIAEVLSSLVAKGYFGMDQALFVARRILHDNGADFWRID